MTPLRQGYPHENGGCQIPEPLGNVASESCEVSTPKVCSMPLRYALSVVHMHSRNVNAFAHVRLQERELL